MTVVDQAVPPELQRRCGRCLHEFPLEAGADARTATEWWMCGPCRAALLPDMKP